MADNTTLNPGVGGDGIRTEQIGLVKYPVSKIVLGAAGVDDGDVSAANPLPVIGTITVNVGLTDTELRASAVPVTGPLTDAQLRATPVPVSGSVTATVTGGATESKQDTIISALRQIDLDSGAATDNWLGVGVLFSSELGHVPVSAANPLPVTVTGQVSIIEPVTIDGAVTVTGSVSITGAVAVNATQSGTWLVTGAGGTFPVTGTFWQATQPVSGPLTDAELRATAVPVSLSTVAVTNAGTFAVQAAQSGTWTVQIGNTPNSTPILTSERPATSGGLSVSSFLSTAAVQATAVKNSAGQIYSLSFFNKGAAAVYLRLYNMTTTPGTGDTVIWRAIIPGNTAGAGLVKHFPNGLAFSTGIGFRCTGAIADNDATNLVANEVTGNIEYN